MNILAIDPGNVQSGFALVDENYKPLKFGKTENHELIEELPVMICGYGISNIVIEMIGHYGTGLAAGKTVFDTCIWIGRYSQFLIDLGIAEDAITYVLRKHYVTELTGSPKAKDANIIQYLIDRFAPDTPNRGKGTKKEQGWFYGFHADVWQAYSLAVYYMDELKKEIDNG